MRQGEDGCHVLHVICCLQWDRERMGAMYFTLFVACNETGRGWVPCTSRYLLLAGKGREDGSQFLFNRWTKCNSTGGKDGSLYLADLLQRLSATSFPAMKKCLLPTYCGSDSTRLMHLLHVLPASILPVPKISNVPVRWHIICNISLPFLGANKTCRHCLKQHYNALFIAHSIALPTACLSKKACFAAADTAPHTTTSENCFFDVQKYCWAAASTASTHIEWASACLYKRNCRNPCSV